MVGEILKKRREELGLDLREISNILKIKYDYLEAIEDGAFKKLPETVYVKGYIREYAEHLKIDPEVAVNAYNQLISPAPENKEVPDKEIMQRKRIKTRYFIIPTLLALFAVTIIVIISPFSPRGKDISQPPPETKQEIYPLTVKPGKEISSPDTKKISSSSHVELKKENPLPPLETKESQKDATPKTEKILHVLEISASDTTWLSITIDETNPKEILLNPGESVRLQAKNGFSVKIGNAGGVKLVFDGKEIGKLGEKGQVIKMNLPNSY